MLSDGVHNSCMADWEHKLIENVGSLIHGKKEPDTLREEFRSACCILEQKNDVLVYDKFQSLYS